MNLASAPLTDAAQFAFLRGKTILVTGGTGFLGRHLLPLLLQAGAEVTCLARPSSRVDVLPAGVKIAQADLTDGTGLEKALAERDIVIHLAALLFGLGWQDYLRTNATAARTLAAAYSRLHQRGQAPRRFVLASSLAAGGPSAVTPGLAESAIPQPVSAYGWSKLMAEQILGEAVGQNLVCLRPPIIYGSGDKGLLPVFRGAAKGIAVSPGLFRAFPVSVVHARDAARALMLCCREDAHGVYHLSDGQEYSMEHFCRSMGRALGKPRLRVLHLPLPLMGFAAGLSGLWGILQNTLCTALGKSGSRAPEWNLDKFREARQAGWLCDAGRLRAELGFAAAMNLEAGLAEAVEGYRREGLL